MKTVLRSTRAVFLLTVFMLLGVPCATRAEIPESVWVIDALILAALQPTTRVLDDASFL